MDATTGARLTSTAMQKSGIVWITVPGATRARPAWHLWLDDAAYLVTGGAEQPLPGLTEAEHATVTVPSKQNRARLLTWTARVQRVRPDSDEWQQVVPELHGKRLNAADGDQQPQRWARESAVLRLQPTGEVTESPGRMPDGSGAAPPAPTPVTTSGRLPYVLGRSR